MRKRLFISLVVAFATSFQAQAQDQSVMITAGGGIIGPACTNCGLLSGFQSTVDYGILDKITVGGTFNYYFDKDESFGYTFKETVFFAGATGSIYFKERFRGFYFGPDLGYISYKTTFGVNESAQNNFTVGFNMGWHINIADLIIINPHMGYGSWFENSKGRVTMGLRMGVKF